MVTRCKYADVFIEAANDSSKVLQYYKNWQWRDVVGDYEYRIKPTKKTVRFYNYIDFEGNIKVSVDTPPPSALWISEVQNIEI